MSKGGFSPWFFELVSKEVARFLIEKEVIFCADSKPESWLNIFDFLLSFRRLLLIELVLPTCIMVDFLMLDRLDNGEWNIELFLLDFFIGDDKLVAISAATHFSEFSIAAVADFLRLIEIGEAIWEI